jgi:hypothetical protein
MAAEAATAAWLDSILSSRGLDADVANVIYQLKPEGYVYDGDQSWRIYVPSRQTWNTDLNGKLIWEDIQLWFPPRLMTRALYWKTLSDAATDPMQKYEMGRNFEIFMAVVQKFQKLSYRKPLMEELKIYYVSKQ